MAGLPPRPFRAISRLRWRHWSQRIAQRLLPVVVLLLIGLFFYLGIYSERTGFVDQVLRPGIRGITHPVLNAFRGKPPATPDIRLDLEDETLDSLRTQLEAALDAGWLEPDEARPWPLRISLGDRELNGDIAPIEGHAERFMDERWPLRVRITGGDTLLGMSIFDLHPVRDDRPLYAWLFRQALRKEGLPAFRFAFVEVTLNGRDLGLYTMEQRVDAAALVAWGRGPGPVLRFGDALRHGAERAMGQRLFPSATPAAGEWWSAPVLATNTARVLNDPRHVERTRSAMTLLEEFRNGTRPARTVLDIDALARLMAIADVFGAQDALAWWNLRFVADSTSGLLLALPLRSFAGQPIKRPMVLRGESFADEPDDRFLPLVRELQDTALLAVCLAHAKRITTTDWLEDLLAWSGVEMDRQRRIVVAVVPDARVDPDVLNHGRTVLRQALEPRDMLMAYTRSEGGRMLVANTQGLPVLVHATVAGNDTLPLRPPQLIKPRAPGKPLQYVLVRNDHRGGPMLDALIVGLPGLDERRVVRPRAHGTLPAN
jgi:hypothetical protein